MNDTIRHLSTLAAKQQKLIIGLMSGTSLDGLDIALCSVQNSGKETRVELLQFATIDYPNDVSQRLRSMVSTEQVSLQQVCLAHTWLADYHADLVLETLREWQMKPSDIDVIASHGQTLYHAPAIQHQQQGISNTTLQIGDGDHIAIKTGILTVSDFRQKHTAAGGEGAPMVAFVDELLYRHASTHRMLINIGGITNLTHLPAKDSGMAVISGDIGPGSTLINAAMQKHYDRPFDNEGTIANKGTAHTWLLEQMMTHPYLHKSLPKTTGPEVFNLNWVEQIIEREKLQINNQDFIATLTWFTAQTLADAIKDVAELSSTEIYMSGGGVKNKTLMNGISELLSRKELAGFDEIGFDPDAKEAVSFAVLTNELLSGKGFLMNAKQDAGRRVNFGKISLPV